jgi:glutamine synthetase
VQLDTIREISGHISSIRKDVLDMIEERKAANNLSSPHAQAYAYCDKVKPYFDSIRYHVDKLELIVDDEHWPLPKYRELLFTR